MYIDVAHIHTLQYSLEAVGDFSNVFTASCNIFFASSILPTVYNVYVETENHTIYNSEPGGGESIYRDIGALALIYHINVCMHELLVSSPCAARGSEFLSASVAMILFLCWSTVILGGPLSSSVTIIILKTVNRG